MKRLCVGVKAPRARSRNLDDNNIHPWLTCDEETLGTNVR